MPSNLFFLWDFQGVSAVRWLPVVEATLAKYQDAAAVRQPLTPKHLGP